MNIKNKKFYDNHYKERYDLKEGTKYNEYFLSKLENHYFKKGAKVLDVGSGIGLLGLVLKNKYNVDVSGLDLSIEGVRTAKKFGINAKIADIEKPWPFTSKSFDVVIGQQIIEHLVDPDHLLLESKRVLKDNGILIITTPNLAAWFNRILLLLGFQPFFSEISTKDKTVGLSFTKKLTDKRNPLGHLRIFTLRGLVELLKMYDFKIVIIKGGRFFYIPKLLRPIDSFFSFFSSLSSDLIVIAQK